MLKAYRGAQKEVHRLQKENDKLTQQVNEQKEQLTSLHQKVDAMKLNSTSMNEASRKELESRINGYLKDIDKCLALLNS